MNEIEQLRKELHLAYDHQKSLKAELALALKEVKELDFEIEACRSESDTWHKRYIEMRDIRDKDYAQFQEAWLKDKADLQSSRDQVEQLHREHSDLIVIIARYRKALEFYAEGGTSVDDWGHVHRNGVMIGLPGRRARKALSPI